MQLKAKNQHLIVKVVKEPNDGEIILPDSVRRGCAYGEIVETTAHDSDYAKGNIIVFKESESEIISFEMKEYKAIKLHKVIAVLGKSLEESI